MRNRHTPAINCGNCHGCCHQVVILTDDDLARKSDWRIDRSIGGIPVLARRGTACIYLDPLLGCTIYSERPEVCRTFHCGQWYARLDPEMKRDIELRGEAADREMLASGKKHAKDANQ